MVGTQGAVHNFLDDLPDVPVHKSATGWQVSAALTRTILPVLLSVSMGYEILVTNGCAV